MKLTIKKEALLEGLNKVSKAISTKNLIPILSGVRFDLTKERLTLTASDNDITIQTYIENDKKNEVMKIESCGSIIIQGKYILDIVRKLPDEFINIEVIDELKILIYTENSEFNLNGFSEDEYPSIDLEENKTPVLVLVKDLKEIVSQTAFSTSNDESKPVLTGINFKIVGNILECNATDSYRLSRKIVKLNEVADDNYNVIIPSRNIIEFVKILGEDDDLVEMHIFSNKVLLKSENVLFQSRLVNGTYPNTSNLMPSESLLIISTSLNDLYNVIDRASILTSDKEKNIVTLETIDNTLILRSSSVEIGRVEEKMNIEKNINENVKISFSAKFMMEALKSFNKNAIELHFTGEVKPILVKSKEDESLTQLVLPIRTY